MTGFESFSLYCAFSYLRTVVDFEEKFFVHICISFYYYNTANFSVQSGKVNYRPWM